MLLAIAEDRPKRCERSARGAVADASGRLYAHLTPSLVDVAGGRYRGRRPPSRISSSASFASTCSTARSAERLGAGRPGRDRDPSTRAAYPGTWFTPRMLATGPYVGVGRQGLLSCVAGVHVLLAGMGRRGARQRRDAAGAPRPRARAREPAPRSAGCCWRTGSRRSRSTFAPTTPRRSRRTRRLGFEPVADYVETTLEARAT